MNQTTRIEEFFSTFRGGTETLKQYINYQKEFTDGEEAIIEKKKNEIIEKEFNIVFNKRESYFLHDYLKYSGGVFDRLVIKKIIFIVMGAILIILKFVQ